MLFLLEATFFFSNKPRCRGLRRIFLHQPSSGSINDQVLRGETSPSHWSPTCCVFHSWIWMAGWGQWTLLMNGWLQSVFVSFSQGYLKRQKKPSVSPMNYWLAAGREQVLQTIRKTHFTMRTLRVFQHILILSHLLRLRVTFLQNNKANKAFKFFRFFLWNVGP